MSLCFGLATLLAATAPAAARGSSDRPVLLATAPTRLLPLAATGSSGETLADARRLSQQLRYEEAIVEYQRYLADLDRPVGERAQALLELGFIHLVLGDEVTAQRRTVEALEVDPSVRLPPGAPGKQLALLERERQRLASQTHLEVLPRGQSDLPQQLRARLTDPQKRVKRTLLRHALSPRGPFYSSPLECTQDGCLGTLPPPEGASAFTAFYYLEAIDETGATLAQAGSPTAPLQLSVVGRSAWYKSPWVWGAGGAAVVAIAGVVFLLSPQPPR